MLEIIRPDKGARQVVVMRDDVEAVRLRSVPVSDESIEAETGDGTLVIEGTWSGHFRAGEVTGRPSEAPDEPAPFRARYRGDTVREVVLDGRPLEIRRRTIIKGSHRYADSGRWLAETDVHGYLRPRITLRARDGVTLHRQVFLLCLDLYTCRRNTSAAQTLGFRFVPIRTI